MKESDRNYIEEMIETAIAKVKTLSESNTIVGDPIENPNGTIIIPISKVSVGFVVGGDEYNSQNKKMPYPLAGGSGGGASVTPVGFIVESDGETKFIDVENKTTYQTILNMANLILQKLKNKELEDEKQSDN